MIDWWYKLLIFLGSGTLAVLGNIVLKSGVNKLGGISLSVAGLIDLFQKILSTRELLLGFLLYGLGAILYLKLLSFSDVTKSYPLLIAYMFILLTLFGQSFLKEPLTWTKALGLVVIILGIIIMSHR